MRGTDKGAYQRIADRLLTDQPKPRRVACMVDGKLVQGAASLHRTEWVRRWRLFWRLKSRRWVARMRVDEPLYFNDYDSEDDLK